MATTIDIAKIIVAPSISRDIAHVDTLKKILRRRHQQNELEAENEIPEALVHSITGVGYLLVRNFDLYMASMLLEIKTLKACIGKTIDPKESFQIEIDKEWNKQTKNNWEWFIRVRRFGELYKKYFPDGLPGLPTFFEYAIRELGVPEQQYRAIHSMDKLPSHVAATIGTTEIDQAAVVKVIESVKKTSAEIRLKEDTLRPVSETAIINHLHAQTVAQYKYICPQCGHNLGVPDMRFTNQDERIMIGKRYVELLTEKIFSRLDEPSQQKFLLLAIQCLESKRDGRPLPT